MREERVAIGDLTLASGETLENVEQFVTIAGEVRDGGANAILVPHALTGDANPQSWWAGIVGAGAPFDPAHHAIVGVNVLGGCYGSTGPSSLAPDGRPYGSRFPIVTVRDMVAAQRRALAALGIEQFAIVAGGSLGGMQALRWAFDFPDRVGAAIVVGAYDHFSATGIAYNTVAADAIRLDPHFRGGDYYGGPLPLRGMGIARKLAMITYKSDALFAERFERRPNRHGGDPFRERDARFDIEGYLDEQARRLGDRFDANTYLVLSRAMDLFETRDLPIPANLPPLAFVGISSDVLFPPSYVEAAAQRFRTAGFAATYAELVSLHGHDAFLAETAALAAILRPLLAPRVTAA